MSVKSAGAQVQNLCIPRGIACLDVLNAGKFPLLGPNAVVVVRTGDGELRDLTWAPDTDTLVEPVALSSPDGLNVLRHSTAHIMAQAVQDLFPQAKLGVGPPIEDGFYYDFDVDTPFQQEDIERIELRMREIIKSGQRFSRRVFASQVAAEAELAQEPYKLQLIGLKGESQAADVMEVGKGELSIYDNIDAKTGELCWSDLCRGPHLPSTRLIPAFSLTRNAAAYWLGDEKEKQLQRIYGTAWANRDDLKKYLKRLEEAAKRDHRKIGADLELFTFSDDVGKGLPLWMPNGTVIRDELEGWARSEERKLGYQRVSTPHITKDSLYYLSGHLPYYAEDLYSPIDIEGDQYYLRPMNCPHHHMVYRSRPRSYRELPFKIAEYGTVYRYERSGQLSGIMRARGFTQNDGHIYCTMDQAKDQFLEVMRMHDKFYRALGITDFHMVLALRDPANTTKYHDDEQMWQDAERITREAMEESAIPFVEDFGGAAHYGPKVDFIVKSVTGRPFAASTNQVDLYTPQRFELSCNGTDGTAEPIAVIHRAPLGSHERFVGFLTEHFGGAFPIWLAPEQIRVIPIMPELTTYAIKVRDLLFGEEFRVDVDAGDARLNAKVRTAVTRKIPLIIVVGRREAEEGKVSVRYRSGEEVSMTIAEFVVHAQELVSSKSLKWAGHLARESD